MRTWNAKLDNGRTIAIKAAKADAERLMQDLGKLSKIGQYSKELGGTKGDPKSEHACILWAPFSTGTAATLQDPEAFERDKTELFAAIPDVVTGIDFTRIRTLAARVFIKHVPVVDKRRTPEQDAAQQEEFGRIAASMKASSDTWRAAHCLPEPVAIPAHNGAMVINLQITFDDSDIQTDYFHSHASIGDAMLLAIVNKQPETERLMRSIVARYPELAALAWTWHTENYSGGHGNYLMSETFGTEKHKAYDGREEVGVRYEISANKWAKGDARAWKHYPGLAQ